MIMLRVLSPGDVTRAAYHQAGHVVVAYVLGLPVPDLSLEPDPEAAETCGYSLWADALAEEGAGAAGDVEGLEAEAIACLAGPIAEAMVAGEFDEGVAEDDLYLALDLAEAAVGGEEGRDAFLDRAEDRAESLLDEAWTAVEAVAGALVEARGLDADRVREIVAGALGSSEA